MKRIILHVDMDAFYASVEQRDNKELRGKPIAVGGRSERGVVTTASYEARPYGVHSAMSMERAKQLCKDLVIVPGNREKYKKVSEEMFSILRRYTDKIEKISIDEAFLDISGQDYKTVTKSIKRDILNELGLTISIGVSYNKFLAKLASDMEKPDGLTVIGREKSKELLGPLSVGKIFGVGPKMELELNRLGLFYIEDIQNYDRDILELKFGKKGKEIYNYSFGIDKRELECNISSQSIGEEETFERDITDKSILYEKLYEHSVNLEKQLNKKKLLYNTITVKIKYSDFTTETRSMTLSLPEDNRDRIYELSKYILDNRFKLNESVRLIGISLSNLIYPKDPYQMSIDLKD